jgi:CheY-like chemotaxis protein
MAESKKGNVLVIDDDPMNLNLIRIVLQKGNYAVFEAKNAESGIKIAHRHHPDIILMDIQLPGMDGLEATRLIKSDPELKDIPVEALTAFAMQREIEQAYEAGCVGHISKPIDVHSFVDTMENFVAETQTA